MPFHEGELEAQRRADVTDLAARVASIIGTSPSPPFAAFLHARSFVVVGTRGGDGSVHASLLSGPPGFIRVAGEGVVELRPAGGHLDGVARDLEATGVIALLAIDFSMARRVRVN